MNLTKTMRDEYALLFKTCKITESRRRRRIEQIIGIMLANKQVYQRTAGNVGGGIPWYFIAILHQMESDQDFRTHLHNGDPLTKRTTHVPRGRPIEGAPPFSWEESAVDALWMKNFHSWGDWTVPGMLYCFERFNGWGYRRKDVNSPYLWSWSQHYSAGKYVADGVYSSTAVSKQCGAAVLLSYISQQELLDSDPLLSYSRKLLPKAVFLQEFLNSFDGNALVVDGKPGKQTSSAFFRVFGMYLKGDSRQK